MNLECEILISLSNQDLTLPKTPLTGFQNLSGVFAAKTRLIPPKSGRSGNDQY